MGFIRRHKKGQDYGPERQGRRVPGRMLDGHHAPSKPLWRGGRVSEDTDPTNAYGIPRPQMESDDSDPTPPHGIPRPDTRGL